MLFYLNQTLMKSNKITFCTYFTCNLNNIRRNQSAFCPFKMVVST